MIFKQLLLLVTGIMLFHCFISPSLSQAQINNIEILDEINTLRKTGCNCGGQEMPPVKELRWSNRLEKAATRHVHDMFDNSHFDHYGTDGSDVGDRISATGYKWSYVGENIHHGSTTISGAVQEWLTSPDHCKLIMDPQFTEMATANKERYWVLDLGDGE